GSAHAARQEEVRGFSMVVGRVEDELKGLLPLDLLLLNPPRGGVEGSVPELLSHDMIPRIVYVSCDPATLARDLARMGPGYRVESVRSFDLFPQTGHVETVVSLSAVRQESA
ncbi:23S rRNA (uracil-5-)-methyltransferase RumA, partial [Gemmatimonadota bacterium]